jgi:hypothetical protein
MSFCALLQVICDLLACGFPLDRSTHAKALNNALTRKQFVRNSKKLLAMARTPATLAVHVAAAQEEGVLEPVHAEFILAAQQAIAAAAPTARAAALQAVVCAV